MHHSQRGLITISRTNRVLLAAFARRRRRWPAPLPAIMSETTSMTRPAGNSETEQMRLPRFLSR